MPTQPQQAPSGIESAVWALIILQLLGLLLPWALNVLKLKVGGNGGAPKSLMDAACKAREHLAAYADEQGEVLSGLVEAQRETAAILARIQAAMDHGQQRAKEFEQEARRQWEAVAARDARAETERALALGSLGRLEAARVAEPSHPRR